LISYLTYGTVLLMTRQNQLIAIRTGVASEAEKALTSLYHGIQKSALLSGISRIYHPKDDDGDPLPPESNGVQLSCETVLLQTQNALTRLFDVTLTQESTNCLAKADIVVEGVTLISDVPVTYLLFLERQLVHLHTLVSSLPTLAADRQWTLDPAFGVWTTPPVETVRTKRVPRVLVKYEATPQHPAQVDTYTEDIVVGYWTTVQLSGALPVPRYVELLTRVNLLMAAVKFAREEANMHEVTDHRAGTALLGYLFAPSTANAVA
jgi:hypothetical protein